MLNISVECPLAKKIKSRCSFYCISYYDKMTSNQSPTIFYAPFACASLMGHTPASRESDIVFIINIAVGEKIMRA